MSIFSSSTPVVRPASPGSHRLVPPRLELGGGLPAKTTSAVRAFNQLFGAPLLGLIWLYRQLISPALHLAAGPSCGCRFYPSCSEYAAEAIRVHGPLAGLFLATKRLVSCTPLHPGGIDFVPSPTALRPRCVRARGTRSPKD